MIKYRLHHGKISTVVIKSETKHQVILENGVRLNKNSSYQQFFDTLGEVLEFKVQEAEKEVLASETLLERTKRRLDLAVQSLNDARLEYREFLKDAEALSKKMTNHIDKKGA